MVNSSFEGTIFLRSSSNTRSLAVILPERQRTRNTAYPPGVNEQLIENIGFHLVQQEDVTENAALVSGR
jgi:hypothetical protein